MKSVHPCEEVFATEAGGIQARKDNLTLAPTLTLTLTLTLALTLTLTLI